MKKRMFPAESSCSESLTFYTGYHSEALRLVILSKAKNLVFKVSIEFPHEFCPRYDAR